MKILTIIMLMVAFGLPAAKQTMKEYEKSYHYFWTDTCKTLKSSKTKLAENIKEVEKDLDIKVCKYVTACSKIRFTVFARNCWKSDVELIKCLEDKNVVLKCLELE